MGEGGNEKAPFGLDSEGILGRYYRHMLKSLGCKAHGELLSVIGLVGTGTSFKSDLYVTWTIKVN
jgi:hypothetical protein